jgi:MoaA/NifB/PqqE/SkfB family radical SAM enzyme
MNQMVQKVEEYFLKNPLQTARHLSGDCGVSLNNLRSILPKFRNDEKIQRRLASWGPGDGYCIRVMNNILQESAIIEAIHKGQPVYPSVIELHTGPTCPCACIFCYSKGETTLESECSGYCPASGIKPLTSDQILSVVEVLVDKGCGSIYFSGGLEPFSTRTTVEVLRGLPKGPKVRIYTNGVSDILCDEVLELAMARASQIRFSIHAATPKTYAVVQMPHRRDGEEIFHEVTRRVKQALHIQRRLLDSGKPAAQIGVTFLVVPANNAEIEQAVSMWAEVGLNFFDIGNDALTEDPRTAIIDPQQKSRLDEGLKRLKEFSESGGLGKMRVRPSREGAQKLLKPDAGTCYAPLFKAVIDPYGTRWACCMRAHPALQHGKFRIGQPLTCGADFVRFVEQQSVAPQNLRDIPLPWHCRECTEFEYVANICAKKLLDDLSFGIRLTEQPFVPSPLTRSQLGS